MGVFQINFCLLYLRGGVLWHFKLIAVKYIDLYKGIIKMGIRTRQLCSTNSIWCTEQPTHSHFIDLLCALHGAIIAPWPQFLGSEMHISVLLLYVRFFSYAIIFFILMVPSGESALNELLEVWWFWQKMDPFLCVRFSNSFCYVHWRSNIRVITVFKWDVDILFKVSEVLRLFLFFEILWFVQIIVK